MLRQTFAFGECAFIQALREIVRAAPRHVFLRGAGDDGFRFRHGHDHQDEVYEGCARTRAHVEWYTSRALTLPPEWQTLATLVASLVQGLGIEDAAVEDDQVD